jgi:L-Ala-D/L-Glu epimerase
MQFSCYAESWPIAGTFTIARGSKIAADVVVVKFQRNGFTGHGECVPYARYNETVPQVLAALQASRQDIERFVLSRHPREGGDPDFQHTHSEKVWIPAFAGMTDVFGKLPYAARNAFDCALWDLHCKESNTSAFEKAGIINPIALTTAYTLSLDTPEAMAAAAKAATGRNLLKLKLGREGDEQRLAAIRAAVPTARLIVDANEGWGPTILPAMLAACERYGVELVEQPLPAQDDEILRGMKRNTIICADESAHGLESLEKLKGKYDAVNIKLDKTGGLTPALAMAEAARADGFKIMVGCMLATSLAMAPAFVLAQKADYVDLDGPLLLAKDREPSITYNGSTMLPPPRALWG